jgi:hypothetical protein
MALSTSAGQVLGGQVAAGCIVRTKAEVLLALLPEWQFARESDAGTGFDELVVQPLASDQRLQAGSRHAIAMLLQIAELQ